MLDSLLKERGIRRVFVGGLATDYCVKHTVIGGLNLGYQVFLLSDAVAAVNSQDGEAAVVEMLGKGAVSIVLEDIDV